MSFDPKIIGQTSPTPEPSAEDEALGEALAREAAMLASRYPADPHKQRPKQPAASGRPWLPWVAALATCIALMTTAGIVWQNRTPDGQANPAVAAPQDTLTDGENAALNPPVASATPVPQAEDSPPRDEFSEDPAQRLQEIKAEIVRQRAELERLEADLRRVESRLGH